jgi:nucleotide-binding universal stress UspA family protein
LRIADVSRSREWPEWTANVPADHPLEIIDDAHDRIHELIDIAIEGGDDIERRVDDVIDAIRAHIDVTQRILYPMVRRVGGDEGDLLADAAETHEKVLLRLITEIDSSRARTQLRDIGVEMQEHAEIEDAILDLLRTKLDPIERSGLADGLAVARSTSTVSRLARHATRLATAVAIPDAAAPVPDALPVEDPVREEATADSEPGSVPADIPREVEEPLAPQASLRLKPRRTSPVSSPVEQEPTRTRSIKRVVVGVDGSRAAASALSWTGRLARRAGSEVIVANVFESEQAEVSPADYDNLLALTADLLRTKWSEPLGDSGVPHRSLLLTGGPDRLLSAAEEESADLLVVGTRGTGRFAALHVGSLAHHFAHHTMGPLAIVPAAGARSTFDRILVGVDGSAGSEGAVRWCADLAAATGAEVIAVCAFEANVALGPRLLDEQRWWEAAERAISGRWIAPLVAAGVKVRTRIIEGQRPVTALARVVDQEDAGMVVVGTRGISEVLGRRLGRVPLQLVHRTQRPVVLIPPLVTS